MLDDQIKAQLKAYFERIQRPIELVASLDDGETSRETLELLQDIAALSDRSRSSPTATTRASPRSPSARGRGRRHHLRRPADGA